MEIKIKWGVLGAANIAVEQVIPAMLQSKYCDIIGVASRSESKAKKISKKFQISKYYKGYQSLLEDKEIDAVYIPLPNHLHVEWAIKALRAGKHVLVEKPIALSSSEAKKLLEVSNEYPNLKIMEAFMYKHHPQWIGVKEMIKNGVIGNLKTIQSSFSFFDDDPNSIVNKKEFGGGSLMDVGCYPISVARFLFESEPIKSYAKIEFHSEFGIDILATGLLEFEHGTCNFFSGIQLVDNQSVKIFGTKGSIEFEIPFNPSIEVPAKIWLINEQGKREIEFEICNQYTLQADNFSLSIIENSNFSSNLKDAINNMIVIEKLLQR